MAKVLAGSAGPFLPRERIGQDCYRQKDRPADLHVRQRCFWELDDERGQPKTGTTANQHDDGEKERQPEWLLDRINLFGFHGDSYFASSAQPRLAPWASLGLSFVGACLQAIRHARPRTLY